MAGQPKPDLDALKQQLSALREARRYADAATVAQQILAATEAEPGVQPARVAACLDDLARVYFESGAYAKAKPLLERAADLHEKQVPPNPYLAGPTLDNLGLTYQKLGDFDRAEATFTLALKAFESAPRSASRDEDFASLLNNLAVFYRDRGDLAKASAYGERCLTLRETLHGTNSQPVGQSLNNLGSIYRELGDYARAESALLHARAVNLSAVGEHHTTTCASYFQLAWFYSERGEFSSALTNAAQAVRIGDVVFGDNHPTTGQILSLQASILMDLDEYSEAARLYQRALELDLKLLGRLHPNTASVQNNLALVYLKLGDYQKAETLFLEALATEEALNGKDDLTVAATHLNLAGLYQDLKRFEPAEAALLRALEIREAKLGPRHPAVAQLLNNLGLFYVTKGEPAKAEPHLNRALGIYRETGATNHENFAVTLTSLAHLHEARGDLAQAQQACQHAIDVFERALGVAHSRTAMARKQLARLYLETGQTSEAMAVAAQVMQIEEKLLANVLEFTSEPQRLSYQSQADPYWLLASLGMARELAAVILHNKGIILDSLLEDRAAAASAGQSREALERLVRAKERLSHLALVPPRDPSPTVLQRRAQETDELRRTIEGLETSMARQFAGLGRTRRALAVTLEQVQARLPRDAALLEFLRYDQYHRTNRYEQRYGALVVTRAADPTWVPLDTATNVENNVATSRLLLPEGRDQAALASLLERLHQQLWAPLEAALPPATRTVILSPDGELNFVPFAILLAPDGRFLAERYSIHYVATGRDLLQGNAPPRRPRTQAILANPDFSVPATTAPAPAPNPEAHLAARTRGLRGLQFRPLPGAEIEARLLRDGAAALGFDKVDLLLGPAATESALRRLQSPCVLHLATHGYFLPEVSDAGPGSPAGLAGNRPAAEIIKLQTSMFRGLLALAGAQRTLESWRQGIAPPPDNDGIVTAEEIAGLHLAGTWLVVLSACDTAKGQARSGEGVFGLRRGFVQAGARNLLLTLWPIDDEQTGQLIQDFYAAALRTTNAPRALAEVQRQWLVKLRLQKNLAEACKLAGPFVLTFQGQD